MCWNASSQQSTSISKPSRQVVQCTQCHAHVRGETISICLLCACVRVAPDTVSRSSTPFLSLLTGRESHAASSSAATNHAWHKSSEQCKTCACEEVMNVNVMLQKLVDKMKQERMAR